MSRSVLGACALALALLAGCTIYVDDGDPSEPPVYPPPPAYNQPGDEYDAVNHRLLRSDCPAGTLTALDLATGESSVLVDTWPWPDSDGACIQTLVSQADGRRAFATTSRSFRDPSGSNSCSATDLVAIDTVTGQVDEIVNITRDCCDDCGDYHGYDSPQVDLVHDRLLYIEHDCDPNFCDSYLAASDFGAMESTRLEPVFLTDCSVYQDEEECFYELDTIWPRALVLDPEAPEREALILLENEGTDAVTIDSFDFTTGARRQLATLTTVWGDLRVFDVKDLAVDPYEQRAFVAGQALAPLNQTMYVLISVDLVTGEQRLLYDGDPTAYGSMSSCRIDVAYDRREQRVLLVEPLGGYDCAGNVFAVDADTGAFTLLSAGPGPSL
jgi:hypothetical protein